MAARRIPRYMKGSINSGFLYNTLKLISYSDSDFGGDPDERKSKFG